MFEVISSVISMKWQSGILRVYRRSVIAHTLVLRHIILKLEGNQEEGFEIVHSILPNLANIFSRFEKSFLQTMFLFLPTILRNVSEYFLLPRWRNTFFKYSRALQRRASQPFFSFFIFSLIFLVCTPPTCLPCVTRPVHEKRFPGSWGNLEHYFGICFR